MSHLNVEIKARCTDPEVVRARLLSLGADFTGEDRQLDTYFRAPNGRLKLREGKIENALIHYHRPDQAGPKLSEVTHYPVRPGSSLKSLLSDALGILAGVDKKRSIFFIGNVKFHVDQLHGLGDFVEIEAIDKEGDIGYDRLLGQCRHYLTVLGIRQEDLLEESYSDMVIKAAQ